MALDGASFVSLPESDDDEAIVENRKGAQPPQSFARISRANRYVSLEQLNSENGEIGSGADENARWRRGGGRFGSAGGAGGGKSYYDHIRFGRRWKAPSQINSNWIRIRTHKINELNGKNVLEFWKSSFILTGHIIWSLYFMNLYCIDKSLDSKKQLFDLDLRNFLSNVTDLLYSNMNARVLFV